MAHATLHAVPLELQVPEWVIVALAAALAVGAAAALLRRAFRGRR